MTRKIFTGIITSLLVFGLFTSFVFAAEEKTEEATPEPTSAIEHLKGLELAEEEAPAPPGEGPRVVKAAPSNLVWWALGFGIAGFLGAIGAIIFTEWLRRRLTPAAEEEEEAEEEAPAEPEDILEIDPNVPQNSDDQGGGNPINILMLIGTGLLIGFLTLGSIVGPMAEAKTVPQSEFLKALKEALIEVDAKATAADVKADKALVGAQNAQNTADTATKAAADAQTGVSTNKTEIDNIKKGGVGGYTKKQSRSRFVELPRFAPNGWAARQEKVVETLLIAGLMAGGAEDVEAAKKLAAEFLKDPLKKGAQEKILKAMEPTLTVEEVATVLAKRYADVLRGRPGKRGPAGPPGPRGRDGRNADPAALASLQNQVSDLEAEVATKASTDEVNKKTSQLRSEFGQTFVSMAGAMRKIAKASQEPQKVPRRFWRDGRTKKSAEAEAAFKAAEATAEEIAKQYARLQ